MTRTARPTLGLLASVALIAAPLLAFPGAAFATDSDDDDADINQQITICHNTGNDTYHLETIDIDDLQEHLSHNDTFPAQAPAEVDINCDDQPFASSFRVETAEMELGAMGWAVAVCPLGTRAVSGGYAPDTAVVTVSEMAVSGNTYGDFTFEAEQTGWVVQATDAANVKVYVDCEPVMG